MITSICAFSDLIYSFDLIFLKYIYKFFIIIIVIMGKCWICYALCCISVKILKV